MAYLKAVSTKMDGIVKRIAVIERSARSRWRRQERAVSVFCTAHVPGPQFNLCLPSQSRPALETAHHVVAPAVSSGEEENVKTVVTACGQRATKIKQEPDDSDAFDSDLHHPSRRSSRPFRHLLNPPTTTPPALSVRPSSAAAPAKTNITASPWPRRRIRIPPARHLRCRPPSPTSPGRHLVPASSITNRTG
ncbi:unnamed protein product [Zymoseptoria tritici ST99CH_3D7]|uniref:Uncharacterized protein n=1 Tax=Zymoseptoria tritici (strain ST99CH_3D7) TaxID=1276538 RepID=A0A1X7S9W5_ZYMT9|nr:unnamed protein product [Zymoseptoria tritici ST99CH_3D7]